MRVDARTHWLQKRGNAPKEYEDAFCPAKVPEGPLECYRFAVSDGASESMLSGPWAEILVKSFCRSEVSVSRASARAIIGRACMAYGAWMKEYLCHRERQGRPVQWFEEPGLEAGAFATILGLSLLSPAAERDAERGRWEALALGDSCLFQMRGGSLVAAFPIRASSGFSQRPLLAGSNPAKNKLALGRLKLATGTWRRGDTFYLMTDALSAWFLKEREDGREPHLALDELDSLSFESFIQTLRTEGRMRNDDVTMTQIRVV